MFDERDACAGEHLTEDIFGDVRFVQPRYFIAKYAHSIMLANAVVELIPRVASDHFFLADVSVIPIRPESMALRADVRAVGSSSAVFQAFTRGADGCDDSSGGTSVNDYVEGAGGCGRGEGEGE